MDYSKCKCVKALKMALMGYEHKPETIRPTSRSPCWRPRKDKRLWRLEHHVWQRRFISREKTDRSKWDVNKTSAEWRQEQKTACKTIQLTRARRIPAPQAAGGRWRRSPRCLCMRNKSISPSSFGRQVTCCEVSSLLWSMPSIHTRRHSRSRSQTDPSRFAAEVLHTRTHKHTTELNTQCWSTPSQI